MRQVKKQLRLAIRLRLARWLGLDRDQQILRAYFESAEAEGRQAKLHVGCGRQYLAGWLNADFYPKTRQVLHLDATKPLPFDDATFGFLFSEHMIEHFPFADGQALLHQCFRVLEPGGVARISTPDLAFLIDLYRENLDRAGERSEVQAEFLDHFLATELEQREIEAPADYDTFLLNHFVRAWGHQFIYDEKTLRLAMESAGFVDITRCRVEQSEHEALRELEHVARKPPGHLDLESLILEATKPRSRVPS